MPARSDSKRAKREALIEDGTLNPSPEGVRDPKFRIGEFFDPDDVVQVRYEMLRRVSFDNAPVTAASDEYGVSRPTYYQAKGRGASCASMPLVIVLARLSSLPTSITNRLRRSCNDMTLVLPSRRAKIIRSPSQWPNSLRHAMCAGRAVMLRSNGIGVARGLRPNRRRR